MDKAMRTPKVSVIMPVYNAQDFLAQAIESILAQTFKDFEFLIINDGSKDNSLDIIKIYLEKDRRISLVSRGNMGLVETLNKGLAIAKGEYIARQDADDISLAIRLKKQVEYLDENPSIGLVGSNYHTIDVDHNILSTTDVFTLPDDLKLAEVFSNQFGHGTIMARREAILNAGGFDKQYMHAEDYDLWTRISHDYDIANIKAPLYKWLLNKDGITVTQSQAMNSHISRIRNREFEYYIQNKGSYPFFTFHPGSINGSTFKYLGKKNTMYRNMALIYCRSGHRRLAIPVFLLAIMVAPWIAKNYTQLFIALFAKSKIRKIKLETI
jgi:glycosyltransferase involved in cell wall biosynthesis